MIKRFIIFTIIAKILTLICYIISPILAAWSVLADIDVLPYPFSLFHTHDNTLDGGQKQGYEIGVTGWKLWWQRTRWICRNPIYGFNAYVFGFNHEGYSVLEENVPLSTQDFGKGGAIYSNVMQAANGKQYFTYRRNYKLPFGYYIKQWIGWNYVAYGGIKHQLKTHFFSLKKEQ